MVVDFTLGVDERFLDLQRALEKEVEKGVVAVHRQEFRLLGQKFHRRFFELGEVKDHFLHGEIDIERGDLLA